MGFCFLVGHPRDVFDDDIDLNGVLSSLHAEFGPDVPLGSPGKLIEHQDEMGWSWWSQLQAFAVERLGEQNAKNICAVDAWSSVYLDVDTQRAVLWPNNPGQEEAPREAEMDVPQSLCARLLGKLGIRVGIAAMLDQMMDEYGARPGEPGALQVGSLRGLVDELDSLLQAMGVERSEESVDALRRSYADSDERCDDDPEVQCLCQTWLSATTALRERAPLWLLK